MYYNTWAKLHQDKGVHTQTIAPKNIQTFSRPVAPVKVNAQQLKPQLPTRDEPLSIIKPEQNTPKMVHHDIEWNGRIHPVDIPIEADNALLDELGTMEVDLCATIIDAQKTAFLLFANYLDAATEIAESCGGGGSTESNWGRKDDKLGSFYHLQQLFGISEQLHLAQVPCLHRCLSNAH